MLEEKGKVVELKDRTVIVALEKKDKGHCGSCSLCHKGAGGRFFLEVLNNANVKEGDSVIVRIDDSAVLKGILFVYGLPLAGFIAGLIAAHYIQVLYLKVIIFLSVFTAFWYYGLKKGNEVGEKRKPEIIKEKDNGDEREG